MPYSSPPAIRLASEEALSFLRVTVGEAFGDAGPRLERPNKLNRREALRAVLGLSTDTAAPDVLRIATRLRVSVGLLPPSRSSGDGAGSMLLRRATLAASCRCDCC